MRKFLVKIVKYRHYLALILFTTLCFKGFTIYAKPNNAEDIIKKWEEALKAKYSYKYIPDNFDPFTPFINDLKPAPIAPNVTVYLAEYDLTQVKLVGIIKIRQEYIAIIEDPMGRGVFLKVGDYIGRNKGRITKITNCAVYIQENYIDFKGQTVKSKPTILSLNDGEGKCSE